MAENQYVLTQEGKESLLKRLDILLEEKTQALAELNFARSQGDLSENAEYTYAKEQQGFIYGREKEVEALIATADIIDPATLSGDRVVFGATVQLLDVDTDEEITYTIVGENESDSKNGRVSITSPIARALIGKRIGDEAVLNAPKGKRNLEILDVKFLSTDTWTFSNASPNRLLP